MVLECNTMFSVLETYLYLLLPNLLVCQFYQPIYGSVAVVRLFGVQFLFKILIIRFITYFVSEDHSSSSSVSISISKS